MTNGFGGIVHLHGRAPGAKQLDALADALGRGTTHGHRKGCAALAARSDTGLLVQDDVAVLLDGTIDDADELLRRAGGNATGDNVEIQAILAGWRRWGAGVAERLHGAFSIAIWDRHAEALLLIRDRHGTRPLYWTHQSGKLAFATHLPALFQVPWVSRTLDRSHLAEYLSFSTVHAPRTLVQGILQIEPAHCVTVTAEATTHRRYWTPRYAGPRARAPRPNEVVPALQSAVERSLARRMRPAMPRALYLSGGLGSVAIAGAAKTLSRELPAYTVTLTDDPLPESPFARRIAGLLGLEHEEVAIDSQALANAFGPTVDELGHPVGDPTAVLLRCLARAASERARIVFSGDGSEELFGGRLVEGLAPLLRAAQGHDRLPGVAKQLTRRWLAGSRRGDAIVASPARWGLVQGMGGNNLFSAEERAGLLTDPQLADPNVRTRVLSPFYEGVDTDPINAVLHAWLRSRLEAVAVVRTGQVSNHAGMDARFPLLDPEVVSMALALPGAMKRQRTWSSVPTRWPLQQTLTELLPSALVNRPKRSLPVLDRWLANQGRLFLERQLGKLYAAEHGLFQRAALVRLRRTVSTETGSARRLWSLFILQRWLDHNQVA